MFAPASTSLEQRGLRARRSSSAQTKSKTKRMLFVAHRLPCTRASQTFSHLFHWTALSPRPVCGWLCSASPQILPPLTGALPHATASGPCFHLRPALHAETLRGGGGVEPSFPSLLGDRWPNRFFAADRYCAPGGPSRLQSRLAVQAPVQRAVQTAARRHARQFPQLPTIREPFFVALVTSSQGGPSRQLRGRVVGGMSHRCPY